MDNLLPCPFCGGQPRVSRLAEPFKGLSIHCQTVNCPAAPTTSGMALFDPQIIIDAWNRRPTPTAQE